MWGNTGSAWRLLEMELQPCDRAPKPQCPIQPSRKISVREGASLVLTVNGPDARLLDWYCWMHNGTEVKSGERLSVDGRTLWFSRVNQADGGPWECYLYRRGHATLCGSYHVEISGRSYRWHFKRMAVVLTILILVGLIILAAIGLIEQRNKINQLDQSYNSRRATNSQLDRDYNSLLGDYNSLHGNFSLLNQSYNSLHGNCSLLNQSYNSLHGNFSLLNQSYNEMREKYKQLDREHNKTLDVVRRLLKTLIESGCITCPTDWILDNNTGTCYFFSTDERDWHSANDYCTSKDATLAIVNSTARQNFIADHDRDTRWIGLTDLEEVGVYRWVNGELLTTGYWARGEPSNPGLERCVTKGSRYDVAKWNNDLCARSYRWICGKPCFDSLAREFGLEIVPDQESGEI